MQEQENRFQWGGGTGEINQRAYMLQARPSAKDKGVGKAWVGRDQQRDNGRHLFKKKKERERI